MKLQLHGLRTAFLRGGSCAWWSGSGASTILCGVPPAQQQAQQSRGIVTKEFLFLPDDYPDAWPYQDEGTNKRLHVNSKLVVVEGNIASGKSTVAPKLADMLGFRYMPEFTMDHILTDRYGNDMRKFYHLRFRTPDIKMFYQNPYDDMTAVMQDRIFFCRHEQYMNAIAHIFNTGQGVVLERPIYSDFVFVNAMKKKNYIGYEYFRHYYFVRKVALPPLRLWPHLVIYLDCPVDKCLENIKSRGNVDEINVVDREYLQTIENSYKDALREYDKHSRVRIYDWATPGDIDTIMEDIEQLDLDWFEYHSSDRFLEWYINREEWWASQIRNFFTEKHNVWCKSWEGTNSHEVGELYIDPQDASHFRKVMQHEVLKDRCGYGMTHKDSKETKNKMKSIWKLNQLMPERWTEYFFREAYYNFMVNGVSDNMDPTAIGYDPDFLHRHGH